MPFGSVSVWGGPAADGDVLDFHGLGGGQWSYSNFRRCIWRPVLEAAEFVGIDCRSRRAGGHRAGLPERCTHDYVCSGTPNLSAALDIASGNVIATVPVRRAHGRYQLGDRRPELWVRSLSTPEHHTNAAISPRIRRTLRWSGSSMDLTVTTAPSKCSVNDRG
jgi:hypothetical protein